MVDEVPNMVDGVKEQIDQDGNEDEEGKMKTAHGFSRKTGRVPEAERG
jgi:hypothetical protein